MANNSGQELQLLLAVGWISGGWRKGEKSVNKLHETSVWKSSYKTGKRPRLDQTLTDQDQKLSGPIKTITVVQSLVFQLWEIIKTDKNRFRPV